MSSFTAHANQSYLVSGLHQHPQRDGVYFLEGRFKNQQVVIDCASFLHGITVIENSKRDFLMLYESECYGILESIDEYSQENEFACLRVNSSEKAWSLSKSNGDCP